MDYLQNNYIALILIPIGTLTVTSLISYKLGLRILSSVVIGLLTSLISIIIIHRFHFDNGRLINEPGNLYVSIYILIDIIFLIFSLCYLILKKPKETTCLKCCSKCADNKGPDYLYDNVVIEENSVDVHGYTSDRIEHYNPDILGYTSEENINKYDYKQSGFTNHIKDKNRFISPLPEQTDENWINGTPIPIFEYQPTDILKINDIDQDEGLIYEAKPKKLFTNDDSEID